MDFNIDFRSSSCTDRLFARVIASNDSLRQSSCQRVMYPLNYVYSHKQLLSRMHSVLLYDSKEFGMWEDLIE
jgi:hypothetical protein